MRFTITLKNEGSNYLTNSLFACLVILIANGWWPEILAPFKTFGAPFWVLNGTWREWLGSVWPLFVWGCVVTLVLQLTRNSGFGQFLRPRGDTAGEILSKGTLISLWAGIMEELTFRWLLYLGGIIALVVSNWLWGTAFVYVILTGLSIGLILWVNSLTKWDNVLPAILTGMACLAGIIALAVHGLYLDPVKWVFGALLVPLADFTSLGKMHTILYQPHSWAAGAAVVSVNALFRDGHKYQGWFGWVNSWFLGLVFFWVMFTYGLVAAMVVHFLYDFLIFATVALVRLLRGLGGPTYN